MATTDQTVARRLAISAGAVAAVVATGHTLDAILLGWAAVVLAPTTGFDPITTYTTWLLGEPAGVTR